MKTDWIKNRTKIRVSDCHSGISDKVLRVIFTIYSFKNEKENTDEIEDCFWLVIKIINNYLYNNKDTKNRKY